MRVIVTGGCGFIGSHVVDALITNEHDVIVIDNFSTGRLNNLDHIKHKIRIIQDDLSEYGNWVKYFEGVEWVVHLAALADIVPSIQDPLNYYMSNVNGTFNILRAAKHYNVKKIIYSASSSCYGIPDKYPTKETADIRPQYPYALTKRLGEELVLHWDKIYKLPSISLRFFNVYGPRSRTSGTYGAVFGVFLAQKLNNKPFTIVGDGNQTRDFTYVTDIADAVLAALESKISGEIFNVGSGETVSVNKIVELLDGEKVFIPKRPGEPDCTFADITKIKKDMDWSPKISIQEGISKLLEHIDYWKDAVIWDPDSIAYATKDWFKYLK